MIEEKLLKEELRVQCGLMERCYGCINFYFNATRTKTIKMCTAFNPWREVGFISQRPKWCPGYGICRSGLSWEETKNKRGKEMETIVESTIYVFASTVREEGENMYCLNTGGDDIQFCYHYNALYKIAIKIIEMIAKDKIKGKVSIITRPPEKFLILGQKNDSFLKYKPLSEIDCRNFKKYFDIRLVG